MNLEDGKGQMLGSRFGHGTCSMPVCSAFERTPRELLMPPEYRELRLRRHRIPIGHGQYTMAPKLEGRLLQALRIEPIDRVLEIGCGSGDLDGCWRGSDSMFKTLTSS